ncbi:MAG TPA: hypothetical protein VFW07_06290 [Parafilimonas sp.]|nr:hypothetical protein [Parafilimonas sp.]
MNQINIFSNKSKKIEIRIFLFFLTIILLLILRQELQSKAVQNKGVYSLATIEDILGYKGGVRIDISYSFKGTTYSGFTNYGGDYPIHRKDKLLIKLLPSDPTKYNIEQNDIRSCLQNINAPDSGWSVSRMKSK